MSAKIVTLLFASLVAGCAIPPKIGDVQAVRFFPYASQHEVTFNTSNDQTDTPIFLGCYNTLGEIPEYSGSVSIAKKSFKYALMASNAYHSEAGFIIPGWEPVMHYRGNFDEKDQVGFQADQYVNKKTSEIAIVFRGTDGSEDNNANLSIWWPWSNQRIPTQYQIASNLIAEVRKNNPASKIILVGHSLGGGLAFHASWNLENSETYAFDPSPRTWSTGKPTASNRFIIREKGEILEKIQFWNSLPVAPENIGTFDFIRGGAIREHNMYYLARGLLLMSALNKNDEAINIMNINLGCQKYN